MTKKIKGIFIILFALCLVAPSSTMVIKRFGLSKKSSKSIVLKSSKESKINTNNKRFDDSQIAGNNAFTSLKAIDNYLVDNLGLKDYLINQYLNIKTNVLNENPIPNKTIKGKQGWYFLGNYYNNVFDNRFGNAKVTAAELEEITTNVKEISAYFKSKNIPFYIIVPPDKNNIYREYLPFQLEQKESNLELIKDHLDKTIGFNLIDLTPIMLRHKKDRQLYIKSDSHWNEFGAFLGYQEIMSSINTTLKVPVLKLSDFNIIDTTRTNGDIAKTIKLYPTVPDIDFRKKITSNAIYTTNNKTITRIENPDADKKIILYRDSFCNSLIDFIRESFNESIYLRNYNVDKNFITHEKPDVVIFQIVERNLVYVLTKKASSN